MTASERCTRYSLCVECSSHCRPWYFSLATSYSLSLNWPYFQSLL